MFMLVLLIWRKEPQRMTVSMIAFPPLDVTANSEVFSVP